MHLFQQDHYGSPPHHPRHGDRYHIDLKERPENPHEKPATGLTFGGGGEMAESQPRQQLKLPRNRPRYLGEHRIQIVVEKASNIQRAQHEVKELGVGSAVEEEG